MANEELEKIQRLWKEYKVKTGDTQASAAQKIGIKQACFSLYISGNLPMNTIFIIKFSRLVGENPANIRSNLAVFYGKLKGKRLIERLDQSIEALI